MAAPGRMRCARRSDQRCNGIMLAILAVMRPHRVDRYQSLKWTVLRENMEVNAKQYQRPEE
jgi:hypothetical protein